MPVIMDALMLSAETYAASFSGCAPGESLDITVSKPDGTVVELTGVVQEPAEDGSYSVAINPPAAPAAPAPAPKMSRAVAAVMR